jgi:hypothetical protein
MILIHKTEHNNKGLFDIKFLHTMSSVSESGDMDSENHRVVIGKVGSRRHVIV